MPHKTIKYKFEFKIFTWASNFSHILTGSGYYSFLIILNFNGIVQQVFVGNEPRYFNREIKEKLIKSLHSYLFYDPFEAPEYCWLEWKNINLSTMERLIGQTFLNIDFSVENDGMKIEFPISWGTMY